MNLRIALQRLGLRRSSGAFGWLACIAKAPEDWSSAVFDASAHSKFVQFMESPLSFFRRHWDHEPFKATGQGTRPIVCRPRALTGRFMGRMTGLE